MLTKTTVCCISGIGYCAWLTGPVTAGQRPLAREAFFSQKAVVLAKKWLFGQKVGKSVVLWPKSGKISGFMAKMCYFWPKLVYFWPHWCISGPNWCIPGPVGYSWPSGLFLARWVIPGPVVFYWPWWCFTGPGGFVSRVLGGFVSRVLGGLSAESLVLFFVKSGVFVKKCHFAFLPLLMTRVNAFCAFLTFLTYWCFLTKMWCFVQIVVFWPKCEVLPGVPCLAHDSRPRKHIISDILTTLWLF